MLPPVAARVPITHTYHGRKFQDNFHWLKDQNETKNKEIIEHLKQENEYAKCLHLDQNKQLIDSIYEETLSKIKESDDSVPVYRAPYYYYYRTVKGQQYPIRCRRLEGGEEQVLLDLNTFTEEYLDLGAYRVSPNHKLLAYALDTNGSERYSIYFKDLVSGKLLENENIANAGSEIEWYNDNKTVLYNSLDDTHRSDKIWKYTIGKDHAAAESKQQDSADSGKAMAKGTLVYHETDDKFFVHPSKSGSGKFMFITSSSSLTSEERFAPADSPDASFTLFLARELGHRYSVDHQGNNFVVTTDGGGKYLNFRVCFCPTDKYSPDNWTEIVPYDPMTHVIEAIPFKDHIVLYECSSSGYKQLRILEIKDGKVGENYLVKFQEAIYSVSPSSSSEQIFDSTKIRFHYDSFLTPPQVWEYDMASKEKNLLKSIEFPDFDRTQYVTERIHAPIPPSAMCEAPHGTPIPKTIPISIVYRKDLFKKDGSNPLYLYGYGSYGISIDPSWGPQRFSLLDRGITFAIAHIRGGGDCGRGWYETGKFKHKRNTFTDFIACAEQLVKENYTSHSLMAIDGRSAGGLLIGAVVNMKPDIAHVAVAGVPFVDVINTMMDASIPLTTNEYEEWGNPNEVDFFDYMLSYSPYDNLVQTRLPNMLIKAGLNDPRVQYWGSFANVEPAKWVAKIREHQANLPESERSRIVFECKMGSGHFGSSGRYAYYKEVAADYAYAIDLLSSSRTAYLAKQLEAASL